ncbi:MAG: putative kinase ATP-binding protein [Verrucomicrobiales bacterium]|nr:putative kinase ATP-binding protein [Verrucomicrobiales bacterium]
MSHPTAFCPANISLIFETYDAEPPHPRGSLGVGITLDAGVTARVSRLPAEVQESEILVAGQHWRFPTVRGVLTALTSEPLRVELEAAFPFGCGFGMSGASALSTALAVNALLELHLDRSALAMAAHRAEVDNATGLGDVGGQFNGGIMIKTRRHEPLLVERLALTAQTLHYRIHGPISTAEVINSREKLLHINRAGHAAMAEIREAGNTLTLERLFRISHRFATGSGLLRSPAVAADIAAAEAAGHAASMIMLGEAVISTGPFPGSREAGVVFEGAQLVA